MPKPEGRCLWGDRAGGLSKTTRTTYRLQVYGMMRRALEPLARRHGITILNVGEEFTSRTCTFCGWTKPTKVDLKERVFQCPGCGRRIHRDVNAGLNILARTMVTTTIESALVPDDEALDEVEIVALDAGVGVHMEGDSDSDIVYSDTDTTYGYDSDLSL